MKSFIYISCEIFQAS